MEVKRRPSLECLLFDVDESGQKINALNNLIVQFDACIPQMSRAATPEASHSYPSHDQHALQPSPPANFDGNRANGRAFLTSCRICLRLCPESFQNVEEQILWAMSYMNRGRAARWVARMLDIEATTDRLPFMSWEDFEDKFKKDFTPLLSPAAIAAYTLEGTSYFQESRCVDDYVDTFRDLVHDSGYTDGRYIVVKFRRGLDRHLSSVIGTMAARIPDYDDPDAWYELAVRLGQEAVVMGGIVPF